MTDAENRLLDVSPVDSGLCLVYVGNFGPSWSTETHVGEAFELAGHRVVRVQEDHGVWRTVPKVVEAETADFVLWTRTWGLDRDLPAQADALAELRRMHVPTVSYHLDRFWGLPRQDQIAEEPWFHVDLCVTADGGHDNEWEREGVGHFWLPPGVHEPECAEGTPRGEYACDVAFVGSWRGGYHPESRHRGDLIARLQEWYGNRLGLFPRGPGRQVRGRDLADLYASAKVVVGDSCHVGVPGGPDIDARYISDRCPETVGRGGFLLHPTVEGVTDGTLYEPGVHLDTWDWWDWPALKTQIGRYLEDPESRDRVRREGRQHVLNHHTYTVRARQVVAELRCRGLLLAGPSPARPLPPRVGPHPADMTAWTGIGCRRGHGEHRHRVAQVQLGGPTLYHDYTPIPQRLARRFAVRCWDPDLYPIDPDPAYCPARDCVSETVLALGVWEPRETALVLHVLDSRPGSVADYGSQIGWFTLLALSSGCPVEAVEADPENARLCAASASDNGWADRLDLRVERIGPDTPEREARPLRLVKVDVEGAENQVLRIERPSIDAGLVDHLLIEVSPCFAGYYGMLIADLMDAGYEAFILPPKRLPPVDLADPPATLEPYRLERATVAETVNRWTQEMCWLKRADAAW